jgi:hypothetical protein
MRQFAVASELAAHALGPSDEFTLTSRHALARHTLAAGDRDTAERLLRDVVARASDLPNGGLDPRAIAWKHDLVHVIRIGPDPADADPFQADLEKDIARFAELDFVLARAALVDQVQAALGP